MNNPITVRIKSNIGITDEQKNELREKLVYAFIEQLRKSGMYKVTEEKDGNVWILRADLILPKKYETEPDNGWISVEDRLPPYGERVLVINEAYEIFSDVASATRFSRQMSTRLNLIIVMARII